jgi:prepilin-type N-terminal cleavage/methylation domain-containing protein
MKNLTKKGFTLVELLVVISIIGLLSTIAIVSLGSARAKSRDTKRVADMKQMFTALEQYYTDYSGYPTVATVGAYPSIAAVNDIVLGSTNADVLSNTNAAAPGSSCTTTCGSFSPVGVAGIGGIVYMGNLPSYPMPGQSGAKTDCSANGAAYCYTADTAWATTASYATKYSIFWQLEAKNPAANLNGTNCTTTNTGVTCS